MMRPTEVESGCRRLAWAVLWAPRRSPRPDMFQPLCSEVGARTVDGLPTQPESGARSARPPCAAPVAALRSSRRLRRLAWAASPSASPSVAVPLRGRLPPSRYILCASPPAGRATARPLLGLPAHAPGLRWLLLGRPCGLASSGRPTSASRSALARGWGCRPSPSVSPSPRPCSAPRCSPPGWSGLPSRVRPPPCVLVFIRYLYSTFLHLLHYGSKIE